MPTTTTWTEHITVRDTFDHDYGALLERVATKLKKWGSSPTGFEDSWSKEIVRRLNAA